jgi:putative selenate reductase
VEVCPNRANYAYHVSPTDLTLPVLACVDTGLAVTGQEHFRIQQPRQIIHVDDFCNECGNCATFCVHQGKPYADKPRLFLERESFEREQDNAFYIDGNTIWQREGGRSGRLTLNTDSVTFEDASLRLELSCDLAPRQMKLKEPFEGTFSLRGVAQMLHILRGVQTSAAFLSAQG